MATFLHLLTTDASRLAVPVILENRREPGAGITVVLCDGSAAPALPAGITVRRLAEGDLDYASLLELVFAADHVISW
jgi:hypothetical protein